MIRLLRMLRRIGVISGISLRDERLYPSYISWTPMQCALHTGMHMSYETRRQPPFTMRRAISYACSKQQAATRLGSFDRILKRRSSAFAPLDVFTPRHLGPRSDDVQHMLKTIGYDSFDDFIDAAVPRDIRLPAETLSDQTLPPLNERALQQRMVEIARSNKLFRNFIGMGYNPSIMPAVIKRNLLENPGWYTSYTPYQPEISQGRLESLINFQTVATSLTGLAISNASLLDEGTAAAEAMGMCFNHHKQKKRTFLVDRSVFPQTLAVLRARAAPLGIHLQIGKMQELLATVDAKDLMGVLLQYPSVRGDVDDLANVAVQVHDMGGLVSVATDLLALTLLKPPGEWGADIAFGNAGRFGVPLGYGGPHAAFYSCTEQLMRKLPGRLVGLSKDVEEAPAYRLALQTREQHIRRDKATSNVCTAQALLANIAANYAIYHGPDGLKRIALRIHSIATVIKAALENLGHQTRNDTYFDTLTVTLTGVAADLVHEQAYKSGINLRPVNDNTVAITVSETTTLQDAVDLLNVFVVSSRPRTKRVDQASVLAISERLGLGSLFSAVDLDSVDLSGIPKELKRTTPFLTQPIFQSKKSETDMMRYLHHLQSKDLSLIHSITPLGSCSMKLNPATTMAPLSWPEFGDVHPFVPIDQAKGFKTIIDELSADLSKITGFPGVSLQPNSGAQGEYAGLSVIRAYHASRGDAHRTVCLIPQSAHGTNPASAVMCGMTVVSIKTKANGNLDLDDLRTKAKKHADKLAAFMVTYPSTYGVFESGIREACDIIHTHGGQVYLDGANMSAQLGLTNPSTCGADVCHLNLHKTLSIPHGGGGPGVGPICVAEHLLPFLPGHDLVSTGGSRAIDAVSSAPYGSALILVISWALIKLLGGSGLTKAAKYALLNANYMMHRLKEHYEVKYTNDNGLCAHEFLVDLAVFDKQAGLKVTDFAKRLQDYSLHPPTCSWPIQTGMLIEPTESESLKELDRFCDAMINIKKEADAVISGAQPKDNNLLKNAPHPIKVLTKETWDRPYSKEQAVFPDGRPDQKFWPSVGRLQESYGDLNLMCECPSVDEVASN